MPSDMRVDGIPIITDEAEALEALKDDALIAFDLETSGLSPWKDKIALLQLYGDRSGALVGLHLRGKPLSPRLKKFLSRPGVTLVGHNVVNFDALFAHVAGVDVTKPTWYDTLVAEQVITPAARRDVRYNLKDSVRRRLGVELDKTVDHSWMNAELTTKQWEYAMRDVTYLPALMREQYAVAERTDQRRALDFEVALTPVVIRMICNGMPISKKSFDKFRREQDINEQVWGAKLRAGWEAEDPDGNKVWVKGLGDVNPINKKKTPERLNLGSTKQLQAAIKATFNITLKSTNAETLADLRTALAERESWGRVRFVEGLLEYKTAKKRLETYTPEWWDKHVVDHGNGNYRIHARHRQCGAATVRFTVSDPNMQQIPRDGRWIFRARPGYKLVSADYSAIEVWVAAFISKDAVLLEALLSSDAYTKIYSDANGIPFEDVTPEQRQDGKALAFRMLFGGGWKNFHHHIRLQGSSNTPLQTKQLVANFFAVYEGLDAMRQEAYRLADEGRPVWITLLNGAKRLLAGADLKATTILNTPIQGNAGVGLKSAMTMLRAAGLDQYLVETVHDELVFEVPDDEVERVAGVAETLPSGKVKWTGGTVANVMVTGMRKYINVPIKVGVAVGQEWGK